MDHVLEAPYSRCARCALEVPIARSTMAATSKVFALGQGVDYHAEDLVIKRIYKGKYEESLVKWVQTNPAEGGDSEDLYDDEFSEKMCNDYVMWMRNEEVEACCPNLLSLQRAHAGVEQQAAMGGKESGVGGPAAQVPSQDSETGEESVTEMVEDIKSLVSRAKRILTKTQEGEGGKLGKAGTKMLASTMNILSAYAQVGAVANTFRESGALDLLLDLLTSEDGGIRRSASEVLRSLATFDAGSRAYVLLKLTKGDDSGEDKSTSQSRQMLLDLFSDTASVNESDVVLSSATLPQVRAV